MAAKPSWQISIEYLPSIRDWKKTLPGLAKERNYGLMSGSEMSSKKLESLVGR